MGTKLGDLVIKKEVKFEDFKGKVLAVDSMNLLYQFITTIRQRDGTPLKDNYGNITSHLVGLFNRTTKLLSYGIKPVFVFDGKPPELKEETKEIRKGIKRKAYKKLKEAMASSDMEAVRKYSARTVELTSDMVDESKELINSLGLPYVQAPSEGEAQAAYIAEAGDAFAAVSQDYDTLIFGSPRLIRNFSIEGRRRSIAGRYITVKPEMISLSDTLNNLGIDQEALVVLAILMGTDYNPGGVPGIGPKKAWKLVKSNKDFDEIFKEANWSKYYGIDWKEIFYTIRKMPVEKDYSLRWKNIDIDELKRLLLVKHGFSEERVNSQLKKLTKRDGNQRGLGDWT